MKIIAVLLNPTIDQIYHIDNFKVGGTFKVKESITYPVGKAISFALGVRELGEKEKNLIKVISCIGNNEIEVYKEFLDSKEIPHDLISVNGKTRSNKTINDNTMNTTTHIREKGFDLKEEDLTTLKNCLKKEVENGDYVVFSGSLPLNISSATYAELISISKERNTKTILDTSGDALICGIRSCPDIIKPNLIELSQLLEASNSSQLKEWEISGEYEKIAQGAKSLIKKGIETILITLGRNGALMVDNITTLYGNVSIEDPIDTVGSGDAFLAGYLYNLFLGKDKDEAFKAAIACGAANTLTTGPGIFIKSSANSLKKKVETKKLF